METLDDLWMEVEDHLVPGGCEDCAAWELREHVAPGVRSTRVFHDPGCAVLAAERLGR